MGLTLPPVAATSAKDRVAVRLAVIRAKAGDSHAIRFLYCRYAPVVRRYVTGLLGDRDAAEDVTQTTFLKLLTGLDRYEPSEAPFEAWLLRVARNAAFDELRRRRATLPAELSEQDGAIKSDGGGHAGALAEALATLPHAQREVVLLRHVVGLTAVEIADRLERSEASVNNLHHRGSASLRGSLAALGAVPSTSGDHRTRALAPAPPTAVERRHPNSTRFARPRVVPIAS